MRLFKVQEEINGNSSTLAYHVFEWNDHYNAWWWGGAYELYDDETIFELIYLATSYILTTEEKMYVLLTSDGPL